MNEISIQTQAFSIEEETNKLVSNDRLSGAICVFAGTVRELSNQDILQSLELEHYPQMTHKSLGKILSKAKILFPINGVRIIHRYGILYPSDQIVLVAVSSAHRQASFQACEFIMDFLKTEVPFWKKENTHTTSAWVEAKATDADAALRW
jgi:molybdopterin synthase catalytic subunit